MIHYYAAGFFLLVKPHLVNTIVDVSVPIYTVAVLILMIGGNRMLGIKDSPSGEHGGHAYKYSTLSMHLSYAPVKENATPMFHCPIAGFTCNTLSSVLYSIRM